MPDLESRLRSHFDRLTALPLSDGLEQQLRHPRTGRSDRLPSVATAAAVAAVLALVLFGSLAWRHGVGVNGTAHPTAAPSLDSEGRQYRDVLSSALVSLDADLAAATQGCRAVAQAVCADQVAVVVGVSRRLADEIAAERPPPTSASEDATVRAGLGAVLADASADAPVTEQLSDASAVSAAIHAELRVLGGP